MMKYLFTVCFLLSVLVCQAAHSHDDEHRCPFTCQQNLKALEAKLETELEHLNLPASSWILRPQSTAFPHIVDVVIVGGGMSGRTAGFALIKEGISNIVIFDENDDCEEGPWEKFARMNILRSSKYHMGPALGIPSLTFRAWYEAQVGKENWKELKAITTKMWSEYLCWYRHALKLPIQNKMVLKQIHRQDEVFELIFEHEEKHVRILTRKVVLATGREGFGGLEIPAFIEDLPKKFYAHTNETIAASSLQDKEIIIIGAGASAFDAAGYALENGAKKVEMLVRRSSIPQMNKFAHFAFPGIVHGFYDLSDEKRCQWFVEAFENGIPPPKEAVERVKGYSNFHVSGDMQVEKIISNQDRVMLMTNHGEFSGDFIILATGYRVDITMRPELNEIAPYVQLWSEKCPQALLERVPKLGRFPYLGKHFELQEKPNSTVPFLKDIYCFNYGAFLSHGLLSGDIAAISRGATRLAEGIAADFFVSDEREYYKLLESK